MVPKHAALIWSDADLLHLDTGGSTIDLPNTEAGLARALAIINARGEKNNLNSPGAPSRWQLAQEAKKALAQSRVRAMAKPAMTKTAAQEILKRVGLI